MVSGPACPTCGTPLRWVAEHNAWGCDGCRTMLPASGPTQAAQPQSGFAPAQPGGFGGSVRTPSQPPGKYVAPNPAGATSSPGLYAPAGGAFGGSAAASGPPRTQQPSQASMSAYGQPPSQPGYPQAAQPNYPQGQ